MPEVPFAAYAEARGLGSLDLPATGPAEDGYLVDLRMMMAQVRGSERISRGDQDQRFVLRAGITLESELNGLAERVDGVHYASLTFGYCLASLYAAETLMASDVLAEFGVPGSPPAGDLDLLPSAEILADPSQAVAVMLARQASDPQRACISRYISHMMFLFGYMHEVQHCLLGHCAELAGRGQPSRLREVGPDTGVGTVDLRLYQGFELLADSHACDAMLQSVLEGRDLPTLNGLIDASALTKCRLAVLAMSVSGAMWHALDRQRTAADWLHPQPVIRVVNLMDHVVDALGRRFDAKTARAFLSQWLEDLREIAFRSSLMYDAYCAIHQTDIEDVMRAVRGLRREQGTQTQRFRFTV